MKSKFLPALGFVLAMGLALVVAAQSAASGADRSRRSKMNPDKWVEFVIDHAKDSLKLTPEQVEKARKLWDDRKDKLIDLDAKIREKWAELQLMWVKENPDATKIGAFRKEISDLELKRAQLNDEFALGFISLLDERQKKLRTSVGPFSAGSPSSGALRRGR